jgi:hypothetical protein
MDWWECIFLDFVVSSSNTFLCLGVVGSVWVNKNMCSSEQSLLKQGMFSPGYEILLSMFLQVNDDFASKHAFAWNELSFWRETWFESMKLIGKYISGNYGYSNHEFFSCYRSCGERHLIHSSRDKWLKMLQI